VRQTLELLCKSKRRKKKMREKILIYIATLIILLAISLTSPDTKAASSKPPMKSKFYDFSEQLIDGEIKKPTSLYVNSREKVKFERLLKLKKSFLPQLFDTAKQKIFK
tara:strand:- start:913 stop:1236 length:324 start_codon:yes stop_codon:yes gene_type:complete